MVGIMIKYTTNVTISIKYYRITHRPLDPKVHFNLYIYEIITIKQDS